MNEYAVRYAKKFKDENGNNKYAYKFNVFYMNAMIGSNKSIVLLIWIQMREILEAMMRLTDMEKKFKSHIK